MEKKTTTPNATTEAKIVLDWSALDSYIKDTQGAIHASQSIRNLICYLAEIALRNHEEGAHIANDIAEVTYFVQSLEKFGYNNENIDWVKYSRQK